MMRVSNMPRLFVVGYSALFKMVRNVMEEHHMVIPGLVMRCIQTNQVIENKDKFMDDDVVICGTYIYEVFRDLHMRGQLVPIRLQASDFIRGLAEAKRLGQEVNIVNYRKTFFPVDIRNAEELFQLNIHQYVYDTRESIERLIGKFKQEGQTIVLGNGRVARIAKEHGLHGIVLYGDESIREAVNAAYNILKARFDEIENNVRQTLILERFNDGVISINESGRIMNINEKAYSLLHLDPNITLLDGHVRDCIPSQELAEMMLSQDEMRDKIIAHQTKTLIFNSFPIFVKDHFNGTVAVISDADAVQQTEYKIRRNKYIANLAAKYHFDDIAGVGENIRRTKDKARTFASSDSNVLILGETGTGKELLAQSIHNASARRNEPFIAINTAAVPENLLESEFFGYIEGAFTGAKKGGKPGIFEQAHNGTVFLDEIGEIPPSMQAKLLRVLQEKVVTRIGSTSIIPVNVRVISATNINLIDKIRDGSFRKDLFYRIAVLNLFLPPLRERPEDLESIMLSYTKRTHPQFTSIIEAASTQMVDILSSYHWPGNIRELENTLERMFAYLKSPATASVEQVLNCLSESMEENRLLLGAKPTGETSFHEVLKEVEMSEIQEALRRTNGNKKEAAKLLGISRSTLWRKLNEM
jgi:propionate catabolism operon transcriptional regulator